MIDEIELDALLKQKLPQELASSSRTLARLLTTVLTKEVPHEICTNQQEIKFLLKWLNGRTLTASHSLVSFGDGNNIGNVSMGDIAGGNIIKVNLFFLPEGATVANKIQYTGEVLQHKIQLLDILQRRLRILEKQEVAFGQHCPPYILLEIENINSRIAQIFDQVMPE